MKTLPVIALLVFAAFAISCDNTQKKQEQEQHQLFYEVMAVHDEAMAKMGELSRVHRQLQEKLATIDSTNVAERETIAKAIESLEYADGGMMEWMANVQQLEQLRETKKHEEIMGYLQVEKQKVDQLQQAILASIEKGKKLLGESN